MKIIAIAAAFAMALPSFAQDRPGPRGENHLQRPVPSQRPDPGPNRLQRPAPPRGVPNTVPRPSWRHFVPGRQAGHHRPFRFRGHTFTIIGAPLYAAPWDYYPYVWDAQWGARYYDPSQPGDFLFVCSSPQGYSWEVAECPSGWWPIVPGTYQSGFLSGE